MKEKIIWFLRRLSLLILLTVIIFLSARVILSGYVAFSSHKFNDFSFNDENFEQKNLNLDFYDGNGDKFYTLVISDRDREIVPLEEMPSHLKNAFVSVEDNEFYKHNGFSIMGYGRAFINNTFNLSNGRQGGSTITQQLIKNIKLNSNENDNKEVKYRGYLDKYQELWLSTRTEFKYSKDDILEMYLNEIYFGKNPNNKNAYGVGNASKLFFNKKVTNLSLAESAFLAGLPKNPSTFTNKDEKESEWNLANERKNVVLQTMKDNGYITENEYQKAIQEKVIFSEGVKESPSFGQAFVDYTLKELENDYGISEKNFKEKGYNVYTSLDRKLQEIMYNTAQNFEYRDDKQGKVQPGIAAVDNENRNIIALYGGRDYIFRNFNHSYNHFQAGSIMKPLAVYGPALETEKWNPDSLIKNGQEDVTFERAIIHSLNPPTQFLFNDIGTNKSIDYLKKMNLKIGKEDANFQIPLGATKKGVSPKEMASAYSIFPNYGHYKETKSILYVTDQKGNHIPRKKKAERKSIDVFSAQNAYQMTEMLQKVVKEGTGQDANIDNPLAGKTGTVEKEGTIGNRDAWFVGFTVDTTMAIHLGFNEPNDGLYLTTFGGNDPARLFANIMKQYLGEKKLPEFQPPLEKENDSTPNVNFVSNPNEEKKESLEFGSTLSETVYYSIVSPLEEAIEKYNLDETIDKAKEKYNLELKDFFEKTIDKANEIQE